MRLRRFLTGSGLVVGAFVAIPQQAAFAVQTHAAQNVCVQAEDGFFYDTGAWWGCNLPTDATQGQIDRLANVCSNVTHGVFSTGGTSGFVPTDTRCYYSGG